MIFGNINTYRAFGMSSADLDKYIEVLKSIKSDIEPGRHELTDGAYFNVVHVNEQKSPDECEFESHEQFIDIQFVYEGAEDMEYADTADLTVTSPYKADGDYALYKGKGSLLHLKAGDFAVFAPMDAHKPGCGNGTSKKVIIKVPVK